MMKARAIAYKQLVHNQSLMSALMFPRGGVWFSNCSSWLRQAVGSVLRKGLFTAGK